MTTLTRSRTTPAYKDYVNFLGAYKNGKKEEIEISQDVTDFSKSVSYVENSKFEIVKSQSGEKLKRSEIFIEIHEPAKSVSEVSKIFENKEKNTFGRQISKEKPKLAMKPVLTPPPVQTNVKENSIFPPPPPLFINISSKKINSETNIPPPPPPPPVSFKKINTSLTNSSKKITPPPPTQSVPKIQATLTQGPKIKHSVNNPTGVISNGIDRNDPMVKKLVYGTLRGLYGAYHDKANDMMATLPRDRVKKSNGVQDIIEKIASNGDLDKLNGRVNPKLEQD